MRKSIKKRIVSLGLCMALGTGAIVSPEYVGSPLMVLHASTENGFNITEDGVLVSYSGDQKEVVIPDTVVTIGEKAFYNSDITKVTISKNVKLISSKAFCGCKKLESVEFEDCKLEEIDYYAFAYCEKLSNIVLPEKVKDISELVFAYCNSLKSVTIQDPDCELGVAVFPKNVGMVLHVYKGSTAEDYAIEQNLGYVYLDKINAKGGEITNVVKDTTGAIIVKFSEYENANQYQIFWEKNKKSFNKKNSKIVSEKARECKINKLTSGVTYQFIVKTLDKNNKVIHTSKKYVWKYEKVTCEFTSAKANTDGTISLKYKKVSGAKKYSIILKYSENGKKKTKTLNTTKNSYKTKALTTWISYGIKYEAYDSKNKKIGETSKSIKVINLGNDKMSTLNDVQQVTANVIKCDFSKVRNVESVSIQVVSIENAEKEDWSQFAVAEKTVLQTEKLSPLKVMRVKIKGIEEGKEYAVRIGIKKDASKEVMYNPDYKTFCSEVNTKTKFYKEDGYSFTNVAYSTNSKGLYRQRIYENAEEYAKNKGGDVKGFLKGCAREELRRLIDKDGDGEPDGDGRCLGMTSVMQLVKDQKLDCESELDLDTLGCYINDDCEAVNLQSNENCALYQMTAMFQVGSGCVSNQVEYIKREDEGDKDAQTRVVVEQICNGDKSNLPVNLIIEKAYRYVDEKNKVLFEVPSEGDGYCHSIMLYDYEILGDGKYKLYVRDPNFYEPYVITVDTKLKTTVFDHFYYKAVSKKTTGKFNDNYPNVTYEKCFRLANQFSIDKISQLNSEFDIPGYKEKLHLNNWEAICYEIPQDIKQRIEEALTAAKEDYEKENKRVIVKSLKKKDTEETSQSKEVTSQVEIETSDHYFTIYSSNGKYAKFQWRTRVEGDLDVEFKREYIDFAGQHDVLVFAVNFEDENEIITFKPDSKYADKTSNYFSCVSAPVATSIDYDYDMDISIDSRGNITTCHPNDVFVNMQVFMCGDTLGRVLYYDICDTEATIGVDEKGLILKTKHDNKIDAGFYGVDGDNKIENINVNESGVTVTKNENDIVAEDANGNVLGKVNLSGYRVNFINLNNDSKIESENTIQCEENSLIEAPQLTKEGYTLEGWYTKTDGKGTKWDFRNMKVTDNMALFAHWVKDTVKNNKKVKSVSVKVLKGGKAKVTWKKCEDVAGYEVQICKFKSFKKSMVVEKNIKKTSYTKKLKKRTYYVRVRTYILDKNGTKVYSGYSKIKKFRVKTK